LDSSISKALLLVSETKISVFNRLDLPSPFNKGIFNPAKAPEVLNGVFPVGSKFMVLSNRKPE